MEKKPPLFKLLADIALIPAIFYIIAIVMWQMKDQIFYLYNFVYIGTAILIGGGLYVILPKRQRSIGRKVTQTLVGLYMLVFLGLIGSENMQLEGFFFYLLMGVFAAATMHYAIAKIIGPLVFNRGWCGWACWTAMILDLLPYPKSPGRLAAKWGYLRYLHFAVSLALVFGLWFGLGYRPTRAGDEWYWLIVGNVVYFLTGIPLAFILRDNRAFCKYLCPITVFLKIGARFALLRITGAAEKCTNCGACTRACPMDIHIPAYITNGQRVRSTECIFCQTCTTVCPTQALSISCRWDGRGQELLRPYKPV
jgi:ferredoxin-type protein NapH